MSLNPGVMTMLGALAAALAAMRGRLSAEARRSILVCLGLGAALAFAASRAMPWEWMPGLARFIQFPWRLLMPMTLFLLIGLAFAAPAVERRVSPWVPGLGQGLAGCIAVFGILLMPIEMDCGLNISHPLRKQFKEKISASMLETWYQATEADRGMWAGCGLNDFKPCHVAERYVDPCWLRVNPPPAHRLEPLGGGVEELGYQRAGSRYAWKVRATQEGSVLVHLFDFPGWELMINGRAAPERLTRSPEGLLMVAIPAGQSDVVLAYDLSPAGAQGRLISSLAGVAGLVLAGMALRRRWLCATIEATVPAPAETAA